MWITVYVTREKKVRYKKAGDKEAMVAAVATHELTHGTDPTNIKESMSNFYKNAHNDVEKTPNANFKECYIKKSTSSIII